jgi:hypothetical protein
MSGLEVAAAIAGLIGLAQSLLSAAKVRGKGHVRAHWAVVIQELVSLFATAQTWLQSSKNDVDAKARTDPRLRYELYFLRMKVVSIQDYFNLLKIKLGRDLSIWHDKEVVATYLDAQVCTIRDCLRNLFGAYSASPSWGRSSMSWNVAASQHSFASASAKPSDQAPSQVFPELLVSADVRVIDEEWLREVIESESTEDVDLKNPDGDANDSNQ